MIFPPVPRDFCDTDVESAIAPPFIALGPPFLGLALVKTFFKALKIFFPNFIKMPSALPLPLFSEILKCSSLNSFNCSLITDMYSSCSQ